MSRLVGTRPRQVAIASGVGLLILAAFLPTLKANGIKQSDTFLTTVESVTGSDALARHFPAGSGSPTIVIGPADQAQRSRRRSGRPRGCPRSCRSPMRRRVAVPRPRAAPAPQPKVVDGRVQFQVTLTDAGGLTRAPRTSSATSARTWTPSAPTRSSAAARRRTSTSATSVQSDRNRVIPIILVVIFVVLALLLRALVAPLVLIVGNVLSFAATLGASAMVFNHVFHFPGSDPSVTLFGFVFLVALGIDYSIFLMTRVREESIRAGTRPGILRGWPSPAA